MEPRRFKTISEYHVFRGLPKPEHPLISVTNFGSLDNVISDGDVRLVSDFYFIMLKKNFLGKVKYGQQEYDFDEGVLFFMAPGQVFSVEAAKKDKHAGWMLLIHPDFLWNTSLAKTIRKYEYFDYAVSEALFLSEKEETTITGIIRHIEQEYRSNIDTFNQGIIVIQLELLLAYAERFYHRQFITRKISHHKILDKLEALLTEYFDNDNLKQRGLPSVQDIAAELNVSPNYLSVLLKVLTGQSTQQHIHDKLIARAKEKLSTTDLSVSEIAYALGFEHPQSFSKLFKTKTNLSPQAFRQSFN